MVNHPRLFSAAFRAATDLRTDHPGWTAVALYYSAMHRVHSILDSDSRVPAAFRCPDKHTARGAKPGILELANDYCPPAVAASLSQLFQASYVARYKDDLVGDGQRCWDAHERIVQWAGQG